MRGLEWCECANFNCEWGEGMAEPYTPCISCGCIVEPVDEWFHLTNSKYDGEGSEDE